MDKEAIREELKTVRAEIKKLKDEFFKKKVEKEDHFLKGEEYSVEINALYDEIKNIEKESNLEVINQELEDKKKYSAEVKKKLEELELGFENLKKTSKPKVFIKPEIKTISVEKAKSELKKLDLKLQTQVLSLEKESELIKKIQELKNQVGKVADNKTDDDEFKSFKKEINSIRRKFNSNERKIRSLYKQIRLISKEKKIKYKRIDALRDMKKDSYKEFRTSKKVYSDSGKDLKDLFKRENEIMDLLGESPNQKKKSFEKEIKKRRKEVEDKLMKKGVVTNEDLLMFQKH